MDYQYLKKINPKILGAALLFYILLVVLAFTLAPFDYSFSGINRINGVLDLQFKDAIKNIILFIPIGFLLSSILTDKRKYLKSFLFGVVFSSFIEFNQLFIYTRDPGFNDILTNSTGSLIGCIGYDLIKKNLRKNSKILVHFSIPVMNIVILLIPMLWLCSFAVGYESVRIWLLLLLGLMGAILVSEVFINRISEKMTVHMFYFLMIFVGWYLIGVFPALVNHPKPIFAFTILLTVFIYLRMKFGLKFGSDKRFELQTLNKVIPIFSVYILLLSQWPLKLPSIDFQLSIMPNVNINQFYSIEIYRYIEYFTAFTLIGYFISEYVNRSNNQQNKASRVLLWILVVAIALEVPRGFHPRHTATLLHFVLAVFWGLSGALIYIMQLYYFKMIIENEVA
jgi:glycopeptide antibiotics resistance protein